MAYLDFLTPIHSRTKRDYLARVNEFPQGGSREAREEIRFRLLDGDRKVGYGGYKYDGRWRQVADLLVAQYGLKPGDRVLDVGCGKAS